MTGITMDVPAASIHRRGIKGRRRTELGLLLLVSLIITAMYTLMVFGNASKLPADTGVFLGCIVALAVVAHITNRILAPNANATLLPLVFLLTGIGYVFIARVDLARHWHYAPLQAAWSAVGIGAYFLTLLLIRRSRDLDRYRYLLMIGAIGLLLAPLVPGIGLRIYGARLWVHLGSITLQPVELAKILLCVFFASYFADNSELLSVSTMRVGNRLLPDPRILIPVVLAWLLFVGVITLEDDVGFSALLFALFIGMLWVTSGRTTYLFVSIVVFGVAAYVLSQHLSQVHVRVEDWIDPWKYATGSGLQLVQSWYSLGSNSIGGAGLGLGLGAYQIPVANTDFIFAVIGEEMGLLGSSMIVVTYMLVVGVGLRTAQAARSEFAKLTATGLTIIIGLQAFFIIGGIVRLLPLTGLTLPFVSYGGSALVANFVLVAVLMRISDEGNTGVDAEEERRALDEQERRRSVWAGTNQLI